jgi:hypothetical protein
VGAIDFCPPDVRQRPGRHDLARELIPQTAALGRAKPDTSGRMIHGLLDR